MTAIDQLVDDFEFLDDWEDRYRYLIELGRDLPSCGEELYRPENKVRGCASQVWLETRVDRSQPDDPVLRFYGDSDAHIVRGLIAVLFALFSGHTARRIVETDAEAVFRRLGLDGHLTPQRSNGFAAMVARIKEDARSALLTDAAS